jgi:Tol biopolymer transport system component
VAAHLGTAFYDVPFVISPDDRQAVVNHSSCFRPAGELDTIDLQTGAQAVSLKQPGRYFTLAGFSPDGRWVLFWSASECSSSLAADGWPLYAVPVGGGQPVRAVSHMLLYQDFLTWCGESLIAAAGPDRETQTGSALLEARPPAWRKHTIRSARKRSWVSPACAPSGRELAVAAGPSNAPVSFGLEHRSIWLLRPDGAVVRRLTSPPARAFSDEAPRFSRIAPWILFVQSRVVTPRYDAARGEFPQPISRDTIDLVSTAGGSSVPIMEFTSNDPSYYDHFGWAEQLDWSQGN